MNEFPIKITKIAAIVAWVVGFTFAVIGIIDFFVTEVSAEGITRLVGGVILLNVATLLGNQVALQYHLTRIEDKIDKRVKILES